MYAKKKAHARCSTMPFHGLKRLNMKEMDLTGKWNGIVLGFPNLFYGIYKSPLLFFLALIVKSGFLPTQLSLKNIRTIQLFFSN